MRQKRKTRPMSRIERSPINILRKPTNWRLVLVGRCCIAVVCSMGRDHGRGILRYGRRCVNQSQRVMSSNDLCLYLQKFRTYFFLIQRAAAAAVITLPTNHIFVNRKTWDKAKKTNNLRISDFWQRFVLMFFSSVSYLTGIKSGHCHRQRWFILQ